MRIIVLLGLVLLLSAFQLFNSREKTPLLGAVSVDSAKDRKECFKGDAYNWQRIVEKAYLRYEDCFTYKSTSNQATVDYLKDIISHRRYYVDNSGSTTKCYERVFSTSESADCVTKIKDTGCAGYFWTGTSYFTYSLNVKPVSCKSIIKAEITVKGQKHCCLGSEYAGISNNDVNCHGVYYDGTDQMYIGKDCE